MSIRDERKQQSRQAILEAVLSLCASGRAFSSISLREAARTAGLVPAAFYRHFADMDQLGLELADQTALHLKGILHQMGQAYRYHPNTQVSICMSLFFQAVSHHPKPWVFVVAERWGGSAPLRQALDREIQCLTDDLANAVQSMKVASHLQQPSTLQALAGLLISQGLTWAMRWINAEGNDPQREQIKQQAQLQLQLMFGGIAHWQAPDSSLMQV